MGLVSIKPFRISYRLSRVGVNSFGTTIHPWTASIKNSGQCLDRFDPHLIICFHDFGTEQKNVKNQLNDSEQIFLSNSSNDFTPEYPPFYSMR